MTTNQEVFEMTTKDEDFEMFLNAELERVQKKLELTDVDDMSTTKDEVYEMFMGVELERVKKTKKEEIIARMADTIGNDKSENGWVYLEMTDKRAGGIVIYEDQEKIIQGFYDWFTAKVNTERGTHFRTKCYYNGSGGVYFYLVGPMEEKTKLIRLAIEIRDIGGWIDSIYPDDDENEEMSYWYDNIDYIIGRYAHDYRELISDGLARTKERAKEILDDAAIYCGYDPIFDISGNNEIKGLPVIIYW